MRSMNKVQEIYYVDKGSSMNGWLSMEKTGLIPILISAPICISLFVYILTADWLKIFLSVSTSCSSHLM